ncbi:MAG: TIGR01777 family oxidoreductase [Pseudomonadota bacterium]
MHVLLTGGTGFIGSALTPALEEAGHGVTILTRQQKPAPVGRAKFVRSVRDVNQPIDAVINLAGASLAGKRWSARYKQEIFHSRVAFTDTLGEDLRRARQSPTIWLNGSAIGYYGASETTEFSESAGAGQGFAADLCVAWEAAGAAAAGEARFCALRIGVVLDGDGGAYEQMAQPFRFGLANWVGHGRQWLSWIHRADIVAAILCLLSSDNFEGPFNLTAPNPATSRDFCAEMRKVHRTFLAVPMPASVMKAIVGEMAEELLLQGQRVVPEMLTSAGFDFTYPALEDVLIAIERGR